VQVIKQETRWDADGEGPEDGRHASAKILEFVH